MNYYQFLGKIGPWATPAPAAIALAGRLYGEWASVNLLTAISMAIFSLVALETVGGICSYQAIQTSLDKRWGWFAILSVGVLAYIGLGMWALWGVTAWIYVVLAVFVHIGVAADLVTGQKRHEVVEDRNLDLAMTKEQTKQANAAARKAKAEALQSQAQAPEPVTLLMPAAQHQTERTAALSGAALQENRKTKTVAFMTEHPDASERQLAAHLNCTPGRAHGYMKKWKEGIL